MSESPIRMKLLIDAGPEADLERVERLTHELKRELLDQDVDLVEIPEIDEKPPVGAKAGGIAGVGSLLVTLAPSVLPNIIGCIGSFASSRNSGEIMIDLNGNKLQLKGMPSSEMQKMVNDFIKVAGQRPVGG